VAAEAKADDLVGTTVGGVYQLIGRIGEGGMGTVYEAEHLRLHKRFAVKLIRTALAENSKALERFHREAIVASRLGHPHLVNVFDFGISDNGQPHLVMEFLEGEDLERHIGRTGCVPLASAVRIVRQAASAVAGVHAKGIVHRDLKPANIFLVDVPGELEFVKVLDFGVSKIRSARTTVSDGPGGVGTPEYMSPEQVSGSGDNVDHRADQWSLACIAWEMLCGGPPFAADSTDALFYQVRNLPPRPLSNFAPNLPPAVEQTLLRALTKDPAGRYESILDFARAFEVAASSDQAENAADRGGKSSIPPELRETLQLRLPDLKRWGSARRVVLALILLAIASMTAALLSHHLRRAPAPRSSGGRTVVELPPTPAPPQAKETTESAQPIEEAHAKPMPKSEEPSPELDAASVKSATPAVSRKPHRRSPPSEGRPSRRLTIDDF
jgi:serine/threonine protein kinase